MRRKLRKWRLLPIRELEIRRSMRLKSKLRGLRKRRRRKSRDLGSCRKRLLIDRLKSMRLEQRELLRRERGKLEKERDSSS
jgi:hypothetical protein